MDTEEMYRRGIADAERGEPHPFYYQHYYQYRRGYDRARRSQGLPGGYFDVRRRRLARAATVIAVALVLAGGYWWWRGRGQATTEAQNNAGPAALLATPVTPTRTPIFPTPTTQPTPTAAALHVGGNAKVVNTEGATLRSREQPKLNAPPTAAFKEGEVVRILDGPVEADGFICWKLEGKSGSGWSAQQSKDGLAWLQPAD